MVGWQVMGTLIRLRRIKERMNFKRPVVIYGITRKQWKKRNCRV